MLFVLHFYRQLDAARKRMKNRYECVFVKEALHPKGDVFPINHQPR